MTRQPPEDRSDLIAMGDWVADCLDDDNQLVRRTIVRSLVNEVEDLRSLLREVLDGWDADVATDANFGGHALTFHPGGCITAIRRISEQQVGTFRRLYADASPSASRESLRETR